jgi:hypothetical protein
MEPVAVVIPTLNEVGTIGDVIRVKSLAILTP